MLSFDELLECAGKALLWAIVLMLAGLPFCCNGH
jgi:hypothetical protein